MSEFTCLLGEPALSEFRQRKLARMIEERCREHGRDGAGPGIGLEARYLYLVESERAPPAGEISALQDLLLGERIDRLDRRGLLLVVPRHGTQSPWSSKATDIARRCGLDNIARIERGVAYRLAGLPAELRQTAAAALHDRMTQSVLGSLEEAAALFAHHAPRPLAHIPLLVRVLPSREVLAVLSPIMNRAVSRVLNGEQVPAVVRSVLEEVP